MSHLRRSGLLLVALAGSLALLAAGGAAARPLGAGSGTNDLVEVVVTLPQPPLAQALLGGRGLAAATTLHGRLNIAAPAAVSYLRSLAAAQRSLQTRVEAAIPDAEVRWHYDVVLDGMAIVVPRSQLARLRGLPGTTVWPSVTYHALLDRTPQLIGAPALWGPTLATAGNGMKIGIIDDGLDRTHIFFKPDGFAYPPGFPKGDRGFTSPKVIVARAFPPARSTWKNATLPFDPQYSYHATHVAGIAAGDHGTVATEPDDPATKVRVSGIAPNAYLGNYKVLTVPTKDFGLDGNSPEIAAGIEQAVKDGMDVINLSLGEPEIEPSRDIVVKAIDAAADAGVVPVIAAGNDYADAGAGSVGSPGSAPKAITVAASTDGDSGPADVIAGFSSGGPTPISLQMKPDVTAPGVDVLSSVPRNTWDAFSGTSMASPHVAGAAALLRERHPTWTVRQIKSALESTGDRVRTGSDVEVPATREGGGRIDLPRADNPLVFTSPTGLSFGLVRRGTTTTRALAVADAGGGPAPWTVSVAPQSAPAGARLAPSAAGVSPGSTVRLTLSVAAGGAEGDADGFVLLRRGTDVRRVPYWFHVEVPKLRREAHRTIRRAGVYRGNTAGQKALVSSYRYPEGGFACNCKTGVPTNLSGPEQAFRFVLRKPVANVGAVLLSHGSGVRVTPRFVVAGDENRLVGYTGLPVDLNPYAQYGRVVPVVGATRPRPGAFDLVFDTPAGGRPGRYTFRFWVGDTTAPRVRLLTRSVRAGSPLRLRVTDAGSGVDPGSIVPLIDTTLASFTRRGRVLSLSTARLSAGQHRLLLTVSDYQETKNNENVGPVLPNTRTFTATFLVR
jgi:subtilisin family serine protease